MSIPREKRKFHPHLTLGRIKSSHNIALVLEKLAENINTEFGKMEVAEVTLFKSTLKPTGAEYDALAKIQLK
jgi:2'-5' RNA ligase